MHKKKCIILGAGGHAKVVSSLVALSGKYELTSIIDTNSENCNELLFDKPILGRSQLELFIEQQLIFFIAIGSISERKKWWEYLKDRECDTPNLISPYALIDETTLLGDGNILASRCFLGSSAKVGDNNLINTGSIVEHDCVIGSHNHLAPASTLCGNVSLGNMCWIGAGSTIIQNISIQTGVVVGAGSIVIRNLLEAGCVYAGNPARKLIKR